MFYYNCMWWVNDIFDIQSGALITQVNIKAVKHSKSGTKIENKLNIELTEHIFHWHGGGGATGCLSWIFGSQFTVIMVLARLQWFWWLSGRLQYLHHWCCSLALKHQFNYSMFISAITYKLESDQMKYNDANLRDLIAATGLVILLKLDSNSRFSSPCDLEIWRMTPENNIAPLL